MPPNWNEEISLFVESRVALTPASVKNRICVLSSRDWAPKEFATNNAANRVQILKKLFSDIEVTINYLKGRCVIGIFDVKDARLRDGLNQGKPDLEKISNLDPEYFLHQGLPLAGRRLHFPIPADKLNFLDFSARIQTFQVAKDSKDKMHQLCTNLLVGIDMSWHLDITEIVRYQALILITMKER